jgi:hypothetical protein
MPFCFTARAFVAGAKTLRPLDGKAVFGSSLLPFVRFVHSFSLSISPTSQPNRQGGWLL